MLAQNSEIESAVMTIRSFEQRFNRWYHYPYVFFNDVEWDAGFVDGVRAVVSGNATFEVLGQTDWGWPQGWNEERREQAKRGMEGDGEGLYSGREGYHHMCRFFAG